MLLSDLLKANLTEGFGHKHDLRLCALLPVATFVIWFPPTRTMRAEKTNGYNLLVPREYRVVLPCKADGSTVPPQLLNAVLAGGAVVRQGRVVLRGLRLVKALRLGKAVGLAASALAVGNAPNSGEIGVASAQICCRTIGASWANLGGFVGQAIAGSLLDDGNASTAVATAAGGWAGGLAGSGVAAAAASSIGIEALGGGYVASGLVVCGSLSAVGAVAGAGLAFAVKRLLADQAGAQADRTSDYYDCPLRLLGSADDVFHLFGASLEFPPEDGLGGPEEDMPRLAAAGWYAVRVQPGTAME
ncbi:unnamed protein product [Effrenium voratum]|uniref:Uncharacterized protein n=1 Tax=Effrenium voratum TaxID=2562239 RepID=A0AA36HRQ4_9DINO|nr:unnamed protein product [Effrenium voratum]